MTYEYVCEACGKTWEIEQKISEPAIKECPHCKMEKAKRLVSGGTAFILNGSRWASDGYK